MHTNFIENKVLNNKRLRKPCFNVFYSIFCDSNDSTKKVFYNSFEQSFDKSITHINSILIFFLYKVITNICYWWEIDFIKLLDF